MKKIDSPEELAAFAAEHKLRVDWHEPDEQDVDAVVKGNDFDNAGFWPEDKSHHMTTSRGSKLVEKHVVLKVEGKPVAAVNLATLLAWATEFGKAVQMVKDIGEDPEKARELAQKAIEESGEDINVDDLAFMVAPTGKAVGLG